MVNDRVAEANPAIRDRPQQVDTASRRVGLRPKNRVRWTCGQAKSAVNAIKKTVEFRRG